MNLFKYFFGSNKKSIIRRVCDVKPGEYVQIEWYRIRGGIGYLKCLNNDPLAKKILLEILWNNHEELKCDMNEKIIFKYNSKELSNFHLLNNIFEENKQDDDFNIATLQRDLNDAIEKEEYENANELQKKINKLSGK